MFRVHLQNNKETALVSQLIKYEQVKSWCERNVSITSYQNGVMQWEVHVTPEWISVSFRDADDAMRFKLSWRI